MQKVITLTMKEQQRYEVIRDSLRKLIKVKEASLLLNISLRQIYRLRKRVKEEGIKGVMHHLKDKVSSKRIPEKTKVKIKELYKEKYFGFNLSHFTEIFK